MAVFDAKKGILSAGRGLCPLPATEQTQVGGIYKLLIFIHGLPIPTYSLFPVKQKIINFTEIVAGNLTGSGGFREAAYEDKTVIKRQI